MNKPVGRIQDMDSLEDTLVIFGDSDRINDIKDDILWILENCNTLGLNHFTDFYKTKYRLWLDVFGNQFDIYNPVTKKYECFLKFLPNEDICGACTSASFAIDFAVKQGYKKVVLLGVLDGTYTLKKKQGWHIGHYIYSYKHFYEEPNNSPDVAQEKSMFQLQQFKHFIYAHKDRIKIIIPYQTI